MTRERIVVTGAGGQLGRELVAALAACGEVVACDRAALDVGEPSAIARVLRDVAPRFVVNAAAYTAVDRAEHERDAAFAINGVAPGVLAVEAKRQGAVLVHYSTDYVFDGERATPYDESSPTNPMSVYGASKLAGEHAVDAAGAAALTLRTSWVYSRHGQNFLVTMQKLAATRDELRVVDDQVGVPNWSRWIATVTAGLIARGAVYVAQRAGLYHLSARGSATWCDFARAILGDRERPRVTPITTADYPTPARRPKYAVLDASRFARTFDVALPDWRNLLHECLHAAVEPPRLAAVD